MYSSESIVDVLGHAPDEVIGRRAWDFFNPTELEAAKKVHKRSYKMDKASVLVYCDIKVAISAISSLHLSNPWSGVVGLRDARGIFLSQALTSARIKMAIWSDANVLSAPYTMC